MAIQPKKLYSVSELTDAIKALLEERYAFIWISGEISNCKIAASGHLYFTLKDAKSQISAVMFRGSARRLREQLTDGMRVAAMGRLGVYAPRGTYQFIAEFVETHGTGELLVAVEALKQKLSAEGLLDPRTKKALPTMAHCVAVVTSLQGSVIRDILQVSGRRWPSIPIEVVPVAVQGPSAVTENLAAIEMVVERGRADVIVLARGGGSIEDLMAFNDEALARAISRCPIPVVSAIGHETDTTIADLVADLRAPTPSAAAELVFPDRHAFTRRLADLRNRLDAVLVSRIDSKRAVMKTVVDRLKHPSRRIEDGRLRLDDLLFRMDTRLKSLVNQNRERFSWRLERFNAIITSDILRINKAKLDDYLIKLLKNLEINILHKATRLQHLTERLQALSPLAILQRGYSITRTLPLGQTLRRYDQTAAGEAVEIQLAVGYLNATITKTGTKMTDE